MASKAAFPTWQGYLEAYASYILSGSVCLEWLGVQLTSSYLKKPKDTAATSVVVTSLLTTTAMTDVRRDQSWCTSSGRGDPGLVALITCA